jgi:hypothetical protein
MPLTIRRSHIDLVRQWRKIAYTVCLGLVLVASAGVFVSISSPDSIVELAPGEPFFDAGRAYRVTEDMWDYLSTPSADGSAPDMFAWFEEQMPGPNMVEQESFDVPAGTSTAKLTNFSVRLEGVTEDVIVIAAPRDYPSQARVETLTYTSGTGALVELINVFAARPHKKTLVFLSTEDSTNGGLGIAHFLDTSPIAGRVSAIVSVSGLGKVAEGTESAHALSAGVTSARNTTTGWLLQTVIEAFDRSKVELVVPGLWRQAADRALALAQGDQIAGLTRGIPSIRLYDDSPGNPSLTGMQAHGPSLERLLLSFDEGAELPGDPGTALLLSSGRYLANGAITVLAVICLLPSLAALLIWSGVARLKFTVLVSHLGNLASFALPLALTMFMAYFLSLGRLIPDYGLQVPIDEQATQLRVGPILILVLVFAVAFVLSRRYLGYLRPREAKSVTEMAKLATGFLAVFLGLMLMAARSPFLMLVFLTVAWMWPLATCFSEPVYRGVFLTRRLFTNMPILVLGLLMPLVFYGYMSSTRGVGWFSGGWFILVQFMSGSYGAAGPLGSILLLSGFAVLLGVRRMRVVPVESLKVQDEMSMLELPAPRSRRRKERQKARGEFRPPLSPWG